MQTASPTIGVPGLARPAPSLGVQRLVLAYVWSTVATIGVIIGNPAPYDLLILGASMLLPVVGMVRYTDGLGIYLLVWMIIVANGYIATTQAGIFDVPISHTSITLFLSFTSAVMAGFIARDPARLTQFLMQAYLVAAVIAVLAAIVGYFSLLPGAYDVFTQYGRAQGTFHDPNVYGAFLVPAIIYCFNRLLTGGTRAALIYVPIIGLLLFGLLLGLSRGSWINLGLSMTLFAFFTFTTVAKHTSRLKLIFCVLAGAMLVVGVFAGAQNDSRFDSLFNQRATLEESYDVGPSGRFGGQREAVGLVLTHPLGIGALEFARVYHGEDVHEVYLSTFLNTGWIGGFLFIGVMLATIFVALKQVLADRGKIFTDGGGGISSVLAASFIGIVMEGIVIDTDHWRHLYLIMAMIWGYAFSAQNASRRRAAIQQA